MTLVKPLFVAGIASPTLMMTSMSSTIDLLQHSADGDPTDFGNLLQLLLANWCLQVGGAVQLLPLLQLQEEAVTAPEHLPQQQQHHLLLMYQFCNSHRTYKL